MLNVKAILLDIGGTFYQCKALDSQFRLQVERLLAGQLAIPKEEAASKLRERMADLAKTEGDPSMVRTMAAFGVSQEEVHEALCRVEPGEFLSPQPALAKLLRDLASAGYGLAVLSNFRMVLVQKILAALGLRYDVLKFCLTENDGLPIKPALEPFRECVRRFGLSPEEVAYVGDNIHRDMIPARAIGIVTVWVKRVEDAQDLPECVQWHVNDILELRSLLGVRASSN